MNALKNVWYDFGEAKGGDAVNFVCAYLKSHNEDNTVFDALRWLKNMMDMPSANFRLRPQEVEKMPAKLVLQNISDLSHKGLINYLESRSIPLKAAQKYIKQATIKNLANRKSFYTLAIENEGKGFELRNRIFKGSISSKSITFIRGSKFPTEEIHVFEGFMDFLSAVTRQKNFEFEGDVIILNSVACLPQVSPYIKNYTYKKLLSWLDNDKSGQKATSFLKKLVEKEAGFSFEPMNSTYASFKDVNEWHVSKLKP